MHSLSTDHEFQRLQNDGFYAFNGFEVLVVRVDDEVVDRLKVYLFAVFRVEMLNTG